MNDDHGERLARIEATIGAVATSVSEIKQLNQARLDDHAQRLRDLEHDKIRRDAERVVVGGIVGFVTKNWVSLTAAGAATVAVLQHWFRGAGQ